jgi:hypothetical protein
MQNAPKQDSGGKSAPGDAELHPPPSMWWFVIPLVLIAAYALLSK